jgi:hypothetical protein
MMERSAFGGWLMVGYAARIPPQHPPVSRSDLSYHVGTNVSCIAASKFSQRRLKPL